MSESTKHQTTEDNVKNARSPKKICIICSAEGKYKCPTCLLCYCSVGCYKKHRENCEPVKQEPPKHHEKPCVVANCEPVKQEPPLSELAAPSIDVTYETENTIPEERLQLLSNSKTLKDLLSNPHLRNILTTVDQSNNPEEIMQKAMQEPLFVEFADTCLKIVDPQFRNDADDEFREVSRLFEIYNKT